ncbi:MAG: alcohol dehydrogenase [Candidatus Bathyarchaeia archaeon]
MRAMRIVGPGKPLELHDLPIPKPSGVEVVIKVEACGVCHTDLHFVTSQIPGARYPFTPGHEISGIIHDVGQNVKDFKIGERVIVYPHFGCEVCKQCLRGFPNHCENPPLLGFIMDGGYAEYVLIPHFKYLIKVSDSDPDEAAVLTCSALTAYSALKEAGLENDDLLVIIGVGGLGTMAVQLAKKLTGVTVVAMDIDEKKLSLALRMGADYVLNPSKEDPIKFIKTISENGAGADAVIDFVNNSETAEIAFKMLRIRGRHVFTGMYGGTLTIPLTQMAISGIKLVSGKIGRPGDLRELVSLYKRGLIKPFISKKFRLEDANKALEELKAGEILGRAVLKP